MSTGEIEVQAAELEILSRSTALPFQLDDENVDDNVRLRYRWLDLRRDKLQRNIRLRGQMVGKIRRTMEEAGFVDIQTPILWKPTPEGARDFLVPSRLQKGRFYALPQSPQIAKQLLVIAGFERYYQIAICFRDEDLRADRVQEITQLDVEMAFPDQEFLFGLMERMISTVWRECVGVELETPFPRLTYARGRPALRQRQARPSLRARDRGRDRRDARLGVQGLRRRRGRALPARAAGALAPRARRARGRSRSNGARRGSPTSSTTQRARCARRSRSSSPSPSWRRSGAIRARPCCSLPTRGR